MVKMNPWPEVLFALTFDHPSKYVTGRRHAFIAKHCVLQAFLIKCYPI